MQVRLQKHIADAGICSRRKAEELISRGLVSVNGEVIEGLGIKVDSSKDKVDVYLTQNGKKHHIAPQKDRESEFLYIALNKPVDYISSATNEQGASVIDLITPENFWGKDSDAPKIPRLYPVGRLDKDSEGLVLLTNDGELTQKLTHPKFAHEKEYEVTIDKPLEKTAIKVLENGMRIDDGFVNGIEIVDRKNMGRRTVITVILKEGKNRQIRKMFGNLGYRVITLRRTRIGKLLLKTLPVGRWREVRKEYII